MHLTRELKSRTRRVPQQRFEEALVSLIEDPLFRLTGGDQLGRLCRKLDLPDAPSALASEMLRHLQIADTLSAEDKARIPGSGPLVVVANLPTGYAEGMVLIKHLAAVRPDLKVLGPSSLAATPGLEKVVLPMEVSKHAASENLKSLRMAVRWVRQGGALAMFPAGEVAHLQVRQRRVTDPVWHAAAAGVVRVTGATVLPVFFQGCRGAVWQAAGVLHPRLRSALMPRQLLGQRGRSMAMRIGHPLPPATLSRYETDAELIRYLRFRTYLLSGRQAAVPLPVMPSKTEEPVAAALPRERLVAEIAGLPAGQLLLRSGDREVYVATSDQIPNLLLEIGRLRELTFRQVGEGSGKSRDLDRFDAYYHQLFVWDPEAREIVGAYRMGLIDEIVASHGVDGLYTAELFNCDPALFSGLGAALEMGRSFVQPVYQRQYSSLLMLWKGIGHFMAAHPRYRVLFGAVSISNDYQGISRQMMARYLSTTGDELSRLVSPKHPLGETLGRELDPPALGGELPGLDEISAWIADIEPDGKGVPVLIKQYLKLGGRILSMSVDPAFHDTLDGLVMVDFDKTDPKLVRRYMGDEGAERFRAGQPGAAV